MRTRLVLIHALSPLHAGTGHALGAIDLPIARERPTGIPLIPGSSIKGALRARCAERNGNGGATCVAIFGPETKESSEHAGAVQIADAHVILLPVRSLAGTFAWTTSPYLLSRLARDAREAGVELPAPPAPGSKEQCLVLGSALIAGGARVILEDLDFKAATVAPESPLGAYAKTLGQWLFPGEDEAEKGARASLAARLCLVHDDVMSFLLESATEVAARIRLDPDKKTVARGALWYEEALPTETVLCGLAVANRVWRGQGEERQEWTPERLFGEIEKLAKGLVQLGGKSTVGRGSCLVRVAGGAA
jgi:CRISPR-associated protein Cmr4